VKFPDIKSEKDFDEHFQSPTWREAAREICLRHKIVFSRLERSASSDHVVFLVDDSLVLKFTDLLAGVLSVKRNRSNLSMEKPLSKFLKLSKSVRLKVLIMF